MFTFTATDGTKLACHQKGEGEPLVVLPGGPMRASAYLGNLGGLDAHRRLHLLDLRGTGDSATSDDPATYRCDRQVDDVERLRLHLGLDAMDLLAHSAGGNLATLYAARYPERVRTLTLVTATPWAVGMPPTTEDRRAAAELRSGEPWFEEAHPAFTAWLDGEDVDLVRFAPFFYGRWDAAAAAHTVGDEDESNDEAADLYGAEGAYDPPATRAALTALRARVLVIAGEYDGGPRPELARRAAALYPRAEFDVQPRGGHFPWLDDPAWFTARITRFLDGR